MKQNLPFLKWKHGRLKVKTTAEQQEAKRKERDRKLKLYTAGTSKVFSKRAAGELDEELLSVSGQLLSANPDFYTLWNIRREVYVAWKEVKTEDEMQTSLQGELQFLEQCLRVNPKSYGVWQHRAWVLEAMPQSRWSQELELCNKFLNYDERNFHCWDHRRLVVGRGNVSASDEFQFTSDKIRDNFSNFSSWHYRSKLLPLVYPSLAHPGGIEEDTLLSEFELVQNAVFTDPDDQSSWFYHRWLLGREQRTLRVEMSHISSTTNCLIVTLNKSVKYGKDFSLTLKINGAVSKVTWTAAGHREYCPVWVARLSKDQLKDDAVHKVTMCLEKDSNVVQLYLNTEAKEANYMQPSCGSMFSFEPSDKTGTVLTEQLDMCQQLHELEPENKWTLLSLLLLMRAVDHHKYSKETMNCIEKLIQVDPMRLNYYKDCRSKFIMENAMESLTPDSCKICLRDNDLTSLHHLEYLACLTEVDLSHNALRHICDGFLLQRVRVLDLSHNDIETCEGLGSLDGLQTLDLSYNSLVDVESLRPLSSCPHLKLLKLEGNELCSMADALQQLRKILHNVQEIHMDHSCVGQHS
ncbi:Geranylgeranyl transferase type-2 subunit alpha [Lamellibrachia satsuma]|nr:Geranylgeranyl transferase type-2 subunit alpha [Lamellibrachia satsuma]